MNKDSLQANFLNGQSSEEFTASLIWAGIGLLLSMMLELVASSKVKRTGGFSFGFWLKDNIIRIITSVFVIFVGSAFGDKITGEIPNWGAFLIGFVTDKVIESLIKFKSKVDISQIIMIFTKKKE